MNIVIQGKSYEFCRLTARRKAFLAVNVHEGHVTAREVMDAADMSEEEFNRMMDLFYRSYDYRSLRATRVQDYRGGDYATV